MATHKAYTWGGKGLRLVDLLSIEERKQILDFLDNTSAFAAKHVRGDASEFLSNANRMRVIDDYDNLILRPAPARSLEMAGYKVTMAMDGRRAVIPSTEATPIRGSYAPGSKSVDVIAQEFIDGLRAEGTMVEQASARAHKIVFVSRDFAEYLRENGELVKTIGMDVDGDPAFIWPAKTDGDVQRAVQNFHLATFGANEPDGGAIAQMAKVKTPKQYAAWSTGLADQWRLMETLREQVLKASLEMTSGAFSDKEAGGRMRVAISAFQQAYQMLAEDAVTGVPRLETANQLMEVGASLRYAGMYLDNAPIVEPKVSRLIGDATEVSLAIIDDVHHLHARHENAAERERISGQSIGMSAGLA